MLIYFLVSSVTNIVLGMMVWHFYGHTLSGMLRRGSGKQAHAPAAEHAGHGHGHGLTPAPAADPVSQAPAAAPAAVAAPAPAAAPVATGPAAPPAEELRPVKPNGSREVTAGDLADVMSELGIEPPAPAPVAEEAAAAPAEEPALAS